MASWFSWGEPCPRRPQRSPADVVTDTLMLELSWQMKEAERLQRERDSEYQRLRTGVDYSWLMSFPRSSYELRAGERLGLEELCSKVHPSHCGRVIVRFRQVMVENEPDVQEVTGLFRTILLEALDWMRDEEEAKRLSRQWNNKRAASMSLMGFRSRVRIDPFGSSEVKTISEDVERGLVRGSEGAEEARRGWSMPDFKHNKGM
ncbi:protein RD3 [Paramormyrops kingsleyae]|uniref:Retinal degeneration 3, GUCY2D regulator n=1 Tax=Paramormyrops kingsleyae TaxID=1676925 RepID=A0A3B3QDJ1_9TELE|nr:protein RD3 [Paramormyrops kingsleyae]